MVLDVLKPLQHKKILEVCFLHAICVCTPRFTDVQHELEGFGIRLNQQPPNIAFRKKEKVFPIIARVSSWS